MMFRLSRILRRSVGGCPLAGTLKQCSPALSSLRSLSSHLLRVDSLHNEDTSQHEHTPGFLQLWGTGLAFTCAASVADCTGSSSDVDKASAPQPDLRAGPSQSKAKVQYNIKDFFKASTPDTRAAEALRLSLLPKPAKKQPAPPVQQGRPRQQPSTEVPTQPSVRQPNEIREKEERTNWWNPYLIKEILLAVKLNYGWRGTCTHLKTKFRSGIYDKLEESTVRGWYTKGSITELTPSSLALLKKGCAFARPGNGRPAVLKQHPLVLEEILELLKALRVGGAAINSVTARCVALSVLEMKCPSILVSGGGTFQASRAWIRDLMNARLGWTQRVVTTAHQKLPPDWESKVEDMHLRMAAAVMMHGIPKRLVYSMDETFVFFVPMGSTHTFAEKGSKSVSVIGAEDKRGGTICLTCKPTGDVVPFMAIYGGKTAKSEPGGERVKGAGCSDKEGAQIRKQATDLKHSVTHSESHWQTVETFKTYIHTIIVPDYQAVCEDLGLKPGEQRMLLQMDIYPVHTSIDTTGWLKEHHPYIVLAFVPGGCTGAVQIPDTCLNRPFKSAVHESFSRCVVTNFSEQIRAGVLPKDLKMDFKIGPVRNNSLLWMIKAQQQLCTMPDSIVKAYEKAGTLKIFDHAYQWRALADAERLFGPNSKAANFIQIMGLIDIEEGKAEEKREKIKHRAALHAIDGEGGEDELPFAELVQRLTDVPCGQMLPLQVQLDNDPAVRGEEEIELTDPIAIAQQGEEQLGPMTEEQFAEAASAAVGDAPPRKRKNPGNQPSKVPPLRRAHSQDKPVQHMSALGQPSAEHNPQPGQHVAAEQQEQQQQQQQQQHDEFHEDHELQDLDMFWPNESADADIDKCRSTNSLLHHQNCSTSPSLAHIPDTSRFEQHHAINDLSDPEGEDIYSQPSKRSAAATVVAAETAGAAAATAVLTRRPLFSLSGSAAQTNTPTTGNIVQQSAPEAKIAKSRPLTGKLTIKLKLPSAASTSTPPATSTCTDLSTMLFNPAIQTSVLSLRDPMQQTLVTALAVKSVKAAMSQPQSHIDSLSSTRAHNPSLQTQPSAVAEVLSALATQVHYKWIVEDGQISTTHVGRALSRQAWARDPARHRLPAQHEAAFGQGMPGRVHCEKVCHGWLACSEIHRTLQVFHNLIERHRDTIVPQPPKTLVLHHHVALRLFKQEYRPPAKSTEVPSPAWSYSFQQGWKEFSSSNLTYPAVRESHLTEAEIMSYDNILLPFLEKNHHILVHVCVKDQTVRQLNSKHSGHMPDQDVQCALQHVATFMSELQVKAGLALKEWSVVDQPANLPQQWDDDSCGMFVVGFAAQVFAGHYDCDQLEQPHIPNMRINLLELLAAEPPEVGYRI